MSDPTLKKTSVQIGYTSSDKYRMVWTAKAGTGSKNAKTGEEVPPQHALIAGLEELARLTALFGFENEAFEAFNGARDRVAEWRRSR